MSNIGEKDTRESLSHKALPRTSVLKFSKIAVALTKFVLKRSVCLAGRQTSDSPSEKTIEPKPHTENRHATNCAVCLHGNAPVAWGYLYTLSSAEAANDNTRGFSFFERTSKNNGSRQRNVSCRTKSAKTHKNRKKFKKIVTIQPKTLEISTKYGIILLGAGFPVV